MSAGGGISVPGGRGAYKTRGNRVRPSRRGRVRWAKKLTGRCFLSGGERTYESQLSGGVDQGEALGAVPGRVLSPVGVKGGEGWG